MTIRIVGAEPKNVGIGVKQFAWAFVHMGLDPVENKEVWLWNLNESVL
jgi:hypothetical protein